MSSRLQQTACEKQQEKAEVVEVVDASEHMNPHAAPALSYPQDMHLNETTENLVDRSRSLERLLNKRRSSNAGQAKSAPPAGMASRPVLKHASSILKNVQCYLDGRHASLNDNTLRNVSFSDAGMVEAPHRSVNHSLTPELQELQRRQSCFRQVSGNSSCTVSAGSGSSTPSSPKLHPRGVWFLEQQVQQQEPQQEQQHDHQAPFLSQPTRSLQRMVTHAVSRQSSCSSLPRRLPSVPEHALP